MFDTKDVFLIVKEDRTDVVYKLESDADTQRLINSIFEEAVEELTAKTNVPFDGSYTPLEDETLSIKNFVLPDMLKDAFRNPITVDSYQPVVDTIENIKAICVGYCENTENGEKFTAAFQRFRKEQYISTSKLNLFSMMAHSNKIKILEYRFPTQPIVFWMERI